MQNIGQQLGYSGLENFRSHPALVTADAVGVELELEGFTNGDVETARRHLAPLWSVTSDGSLRNGGVEFITAGGKGGEALHQCFERMVTLLRDVVNYDASWRCSTHMHLNMLDFTCNQVARYMLVYTACEPVLFQLAGKQRRSSNFCTPIGDSLNFHKKLISRMYDDTVANRGASAQTNKYTALNFQPLFGNQNVRPLGTIEFRGGRPMVTMEELLLQTNILLSIKDFVRTFEGNEDEMLVKLGDGVFNTVFANGCAAALSDGIRVEELEYSLIQAWMLLKAYQQGISNRNTPQPVSAGAAERFGFEWANPFGPAPAREAPARRVVDHATTFWSASRPPRGNQYSENYPAAVFDGPYSAQRWPSFHANLDTLQDPMVTRTQKAAVMIECLTDPLFINRTTRVIATIVAMNWILERNNINNREATPIGTLMRFVENRQRSASNRYTECIDSSTGARLQPNVVLTSLEIDYMSRISSDHRAAIASLLHIPTTILNNRTIWQQLMNTTVHLSHDTRDVLLAKFERRCGLRPGSYTRCPEHIPALQAYTLFRIADVRSEDHITSEYLPMYDEIVRVMEILIINNLAWPVIHRSLGEDGSYSRRLYVTSTRATVLWYSAPLEHVNTHQTHTPRVSATTGQRIY